MLQITIPASESFNDTTGEFFANTKEQIIIMEHSLISISKWESNWKKPFLTKTSKTREETIDYAKCMTITQNVDPRLYFLLTSEMIDKINSYIVDSMTATTFTKEETPPNKQVITSELIYFWMINYNIPAEYQKWHLNRLITLINICSIQNQKPKKRSKAALMKHNRDLNAQRLKEYNTTG